VLGQAHVESEDVLGRDLTWTTFSGPHWSMSWRVSVCMRDLPGDVVPARALVPVRP
jgi:hypothetical protein